MTRPLVVVICGPAGVGKTTTAFEVSRLLARADVAHALIDSDELDRVHPWPPPGRDTADLSRRNLHALWPNYAAVGHSRLILPGVFPDLTEPLGWIRDAVPRAGVVFVRLVADPATLRERVLRRESGSAGEDQWRRTLAQLEAIESSRGLETVRIDTTGRTVGDVAAEIVTLWDAFWER